jgi:hypothetical protein
LGIKKKVQKAKNKMRLFSLLSTSLKKMAAPISHPCIENGWFMEKSTMWPGQGNIFSLSLFFYETFVYLSFLFSYVPQG